MYRGEVDELVYIDIDREKAYSQALDLDDAVSLLPHQITVRTGDYGDAEDADVIVMAAGVSRLPGQTRLDMLDDSIRIMKEVASHMQGLHIPGILISISNPADIVADYLRKQLDLPKNRCFSTGTSLDSCRLRRILSQKMHLDRSSIQAFVMGEHGDSQMIPFSAVHISGKPLLQWMKDDPVRYGKLDLVQIEKETANAGHEVIEGKGSTEFGIGIALSEIVRSIFHDSKKVLPVSPLLEGEYGQYGIHAGVPCIIGKDGIEQVIEISLTDKEKEKFENSCGVIREYISHIS